MDKACAKDVKADVYCSAASISDVQAWVQRLGSKEGRLHIPPKWMCFKLAAGALKKRVLHPPSYRQNSRFRREIGPFPRMHIHY